MNDCKACGHPAQWHANPVYGELADRLTHCNEWGCKCRKFEASK